MGPDSPIKHVIFIVKENRTFNNYFATYPGAEGTTTGGTLTCTDGVCTPGPDYELKPAPDVAPHDITHGFSSGLYSINGGAMNGYNIIGSGEDMSGYTYFDRSGLPNYWAYADRFVLADHFFTSMYGPTFPEHLYTVAAQAQGIVDNKSTTDHEGSYCDDPTEFTPHFRDDLTDAEKQKIMKYEEHYTNDFPNMIYKINPYWENIRTCINVKTLPDPLQKAGIDWKYYANEDQWMNALQAIRHVRFDPDMWAKVQPPETSSRTSRPASCRRSRAHPSGVIQRASRRRRVGVRRRELDRGADQRGHEERRLGVDRDRRGLGRLRRVLRPVVPPTTTSWVSGRARRR